MMNDRCRTKIVTERFGNELLICFFGFWQKSVTIILPSGTHWTDLYWSCTEWKYTPLIRQNRKLAAQFPSRLIEILHISFFFTQRKYVPHGVCVCVAVVAGGAGQYRSYRPDGVVQQLFEQSSPVCSSLGCEATSHRAADEPLSQNLTTTHPTPPLKS